MAARLRRNGLIYLAAAAATSLHLAAAGVALAQPVPDPAFRQAVAEASVKADAISAFYEETSFQPLWTGAGDAARREAFFRALDAAATHGLPAAEYDAEGLRRAFAAAQSERQRGKLEVAVTRAFLAYAGDVRNGFLKPAKVDSGIVREVPRIAPLEILRRFAVSEPNAFFRSLPPEAPQYQQLRRAMLDLQAVVAEGGWGPQVRAESLAPGDRGPEVVALRDRLARMGYLGASVASDFNGALQAAVRDFQSEHGLTADGIADEETLAEINVAPEARLASVMVAMERLRWMNGTPLGDRHIWVNLPDFTAKIVDDGKVTFETVTVVGMNQDDRRSPEFSDQMEYMVVNPTWNVPRSISVKEYLPMLQKNPYAVGHLTIADRRGRVVNRSAIDFRQFTEKTFPFRISQPPSEDNALGLVKFMFPNEWNIYLHDTPSKSLFEKEVRAYSHGCIRLGQPIDFAYALLAAQVDDPVGKFQNVLRTGVETAVRLDVPVPVHLVYFTAWPTPRGTIEYRRDVYGRDRMIFDAMQGAGVVLDAVRG